jgi:hypothetical protein
MKILTRVPDRAAVPVLLVLVAAACSAQRNTTTVTSPATPVTAVSGATTGTAAEIDASLVKEGYRVVRRHDQILYCRAQSVTGSLFASTVCLTASQIASQKREVQQSRDVLNQGRATHCVGPECVGK